MIDVKIQATYDSMDDAFVPYENGAGDWVTSEDAEQKLFEDYDRLFWKVVSRVPFDPFTVQEVTGAIEDSIHQNDPDDRFNCYPEVVSDYEKYKSAYAKRILDEACKIYVDKMTRAR